MAGPLQIGDIATITKLAWDVYQFGFTEEHNASKLHLFHPSPLALLDMSSTRRCSALHLPLCLTPTDLAAPNANTVDIPSPTIRLSLRGISFYVSTLPTNEDLLQ